MDLPSDFQFLHILSPFWKRLMNREGLCLFENPEVTTDFAWNVLPAAYQDKIDF